MASLPLISELTDGFLELEPSSPHPQPDSVTPLRAYKAVPQPALTFLGAEVEAWIPVLVERTTD